MGWKIKIIKGWKKISNQGGYFNENTGQTLIVSRKKFSANFHVLLIAGERTDDNEGKIVSPDYSTESKAEAIAVDLMTKHPNGINWLFI